MVAIGRDQRQCLGCPILLDTATSHWSRPSGEGPADGSSRLCNLWAPHQLRQILGGRILNACLLAISLCLPGLLLDGSPIARPHTIRLTGEASQGEYRFSPSRITAKPGDTLVFVVASGGPHALAMDPAGLSETVRDAWNQAMPRRTGALRSPLLRPGQPYAVVVPRVMRPGKYVFFCLAHRAYDMRLQVEVK
jgi:plastocyanin